ncbi:hypothetical protein EC604_00290 [Paenibacillus amylolyticus]|uniref:Sporulation initiation factor Spo0A C-terminal domain-containing protein n=1 Tax=Paenibacillus amylolyticus TaxID=1451 RepID=A0A5M9WJB1_PAEAM|nr:hypothetical protein EC604_00290 [Paenibacillus amylolyticus]
MNCYPAIAEKIQNDAVHIELAIRHAIELAWTRGHQ